MQLREKRGFSAVLRLVEAMKEGWTAGGGGERPAGRRKKYEVRRKKEEVRCARRAGEGEKRGSGRAAGAPASDGIGLT